MKGYTEDLLFSVASWIEEKWEEYGGNLSYFVGKVRKSGLTPEELNNYMVEKGESCHEGVNKVFAVIVYGAVIDGTFNIKSQDEEGGNNG